MKIGASLLLCTAIIYLSVHWSNSDEDVVYKLKSAADAFDLVFSAVSALDEPCRVAYQNCVLNENNNNRLDMARRCDVVAKAVACLERESFVNSECELARLETRLARYRNFFVDVLNRCEIENSDEEDDDNRDTDSARLRLSSTSSHCVVFNLVTLLTLFLIFTHSIYFIY